MNTFALMFTEGSSSSGLLTLGLLAVMLVVMYFFTIRPQKKQEQAAKNMRSNLQVGDEITTIGGIVGEIVSIHEKSGTLVLETTRDRTHIRILKSSALRFFAHGRRIANAIQMHAGFGELLRFKNLNSAVRTTHVRIETVAFTLDCNNRKRRNQRHDKHRGNDDYRENILLNEGLHKQRDKLNFF